MKKTRKSHVKKKPAPRRAAKPVAKTATKAKPVKTKIAVKRERVKAPPPREVGLLDAIGEFMADCEELGQEMRDWADNMPESKQGSQKYDEVNEAAETLENIAQEDPVTPDTMSFLNEVKVTIQDPTPRRRGYSRSARLAHAISTLQIVMMALEEFKSQHPNEKERADQEDVANELHAALEEHEGNAENVEFPGMFG